jgi:hypothetical protein
LVADTATCWIISVPDPGRSLCNLFPDEVPLEN